MNRVRHITVTLSCDACLDDAEEVMDAIRMIRGVHSATPVPITPLEQIQRKHTHPTSRRKTL